MKYLSVPLTLCCGVITSLLGLDPDLTKIHHHRRENATHIAQTDAARVTQKHVSFAPQIHTINPAPEKETTPVYDATPPSFAQTPEIIITPPAEDAFVQKVSNLIEEKKRERESRTDLAQDRPKKIKAHTLEKRKRFGQKQHNDIVVAQENTSHQTPSLPVVSGDLVKEQSTARALLSSAAGIIALRFFWDDMLPDTWTKTPLYAFDPQSKLAPFNNISRALVVHALSAACVIYGVYKIVVYYCTPDSQEEVF